MFVLSKEDRKNMIWKFSVAKNISAEIAARFFLIKTNRLYQDGMSDTACFFSE